MSLVINPSNGDYVMKNGAPQEDDSLVYRAYYRIKINRTQWLYAPDTQYGSDLYTVKKRLGSQNFSALQKIILHALQPLLDDGSAIDIRVVQDTDTLVQRNNIAVKIHITPSNGKIQTLSLPMVGD